MKASRFAHLCSAAVRQSLVGAFVVVSLLSASQPVEAHGDAKGDGEMPVTSGATGPQITVHQNNGKWMPCADERELHRQLRKQ